MGLTKRLCSATGIAIFMLLAVLTPYALAEVAGPGWLMERAEPVSPEEARAHYGVQKQKMVFSVASATSATPEIVGLARALQHDPKLIYEYVRNHIDYVPYFGSLKGATLTLLERSGNDFDQASLMIALLRESGFTAQYVYGQMTIDNYGGADGYDMQHWLGTDADELVIAGVLGSGGIPATIYSTWTTLDRVWVSATIGGSTYVFDPAFKPYVETPGIDLKTAMGYDQAALLAAAGGELGADYVRDLNESNLQTALEGYSSNLVTFLRQNYPNAAMNEIIGERSIIPEYLSGYPTSLRFPNTPLEYWDEIPDVYAHKVRIQHGNIDEVFPIAEIAGKRLAITYDSQAGASSALGFAAAVSPTAHPLDASTVIPIQQAAEPLEADRVVTGQEKGGGGLSTQSGTVDFGKIYPPSAGSSSVTWSPCVTNPNSDTVQLRVSLTSNPQGAFLITEPSSGFHNVGPGQQFCWKVRFSNAGQSSGNKTATCRLEWWHDGDNFANDDTDLFGIVAREYDLSGSYGMNVVTYLGHPYDGTCRLQNSGTLSLTITNVTLTGSDANRFQILSGGGSGTVSAGSHRDIDVRYLANALGTHNADVHVEFTYDDLAYAVNLPLQGRAAQEPDLSGSYGFDAGQCYLD
ncbi:MAG: transglutaminase, partial [Deltaproteobacteria bacterium]|nr:transglutaminase [Deltaproteobacteria bacterium]